MSAAATDAREYHAIHGIHIVLPPSRIVDSRRFSRLQQHFQQHKSTFTLERLNTAFRLETFVKVDMFPRRLACDLELLAA